MTSIREAVTREEVTGFMTGVRERARAAEAEDSRKHSRRMALEIGSELTPLPDRRDPAVVIRVSEPVRDWLLGGLDEDGNRYQRRRAAWIHLANLRAAAGGEPLQCSPEDFITGADQYYGEITSGRF